MKRGGLRIDADTIQGDDGVSLNMIERHGIQIGDPASRQIGVNTTGSVVGSSGIASTPADGAKDVASRGVDRDISAALGLAAYAASVSPRGRGPAR